MSPSYERWQVTGYLRDEVEWTSDGERVRTGGRERVTVVFDPRGWRWEVTTEADASGRDRVASLTVSGQIDQAALRAVPLRDLADAAAGYWGRVDDEMSHDGAHLGDALETSAASGTDLLTDRPDLPTFAAAWHGTPPRVITGPTSVPRREALAARYGVSVHTVDKWTRAARDQGLIPPRSVGRRRSTETPGSDR